MVDTTSKILIAHTPSKVSHCKNSLCTYVYLYDKYFIIHIFVGSQLLNCLKRFWCYKWKQKFSASTCFFYVPISSS